MTIQRQIRVVERLEKIINELKPLYPHQADTTHELQKLDQALHRLLTYLRQLDEVKPNYNTDEIDQFIEAINVNVVLLKEELAPKDYARLSRALTGIQTLLRYHTHRPSFLQAIRQWFIEFIYFI